MLLAEKRKDKIELLAIPDLNPDVNCDLKAELGSRKNVPSVSKNNQGVCYFNSHKLDYIKKLPDLLPFMQSQGCGVLLVVPQKYLILMIKEGSVPIFTNSELVLSESGKF